MLRKTILATFAVLLLMGSVFAQGNDAASDKEASVATTAESTKATGRFTPTKAQIQAGQEFLKSKKLYSGETSGKYNEETRSSIRVFQKESDLAITGNFNQATLERMNIPLTEKQKGAASASSVKAPDANVKMTNTPASTSSRTTISAAKSEKTAAATGSTDAQAPKRAAPFQATKDQIIALQNVLIKGKMFTGEANGERSEALKDAVKKYQEANGLKATGGINAVTLEKMGIALTEKQKAQTVAPAAAARSSD